MIRAWGDRKIFCTYKLLAINSPNSVSALRHAWIGDASHQSENDWRKALMLQRTFQPHTYWFNLSSSIEIIIYKLGYSWWGETMTCHALGPSLHVLRVFIPSGNVCLSRCYEKKSWILWHNNWVGQPHLTQKDPLTYLWWHRKWPVCETTVTTASVYIDHHHIAKHWRPTNPFSLWGWVQCMNKCTLLDRPISKARQCPRKNKICGPGRRFSDGPILGWVDTRTRITPTSSQLYLFLWELPVIVTHTCQERVEIFSMQYLIIVHAFFLILCFHSKYWYTHLYKKKRTYKVH